MISLVLVIGCDEKLKSCTLEAKVCPDGSTVGRVMPDCEFSACPVSGKECIQDDDCVRGGCSGTICQSKDAEPVYTTCEFLPEYACYKETSCGCVDGKCQWDKTWQFESCVDKARESDVGVIV